MLFLCHAVSEVEKCAMIWWHIHYAEIKCVIHNSAERSDKSLRGVHYTFSNKDLIWQKLTWGRAK